MDRESTGTQEKGTVQRNTSETLQREIQGAES